MIYILAVLLSLATAAIEAVSYQGFIATHVGIPAYWIYILSAILVVAQRSYSKMIVKLFQIAAIISSLLYVVLVFMETITYPNFVFTSIHVNPFTFQFFVALVVFHSLIISRTNLAKSLLLAGLIYVGTDGAGRVLGMAYTGVVEIASDPLASYATKMTKAYPGFYPAMQLVKTLTPDDATILIPPQGNPWDIEGNMAMVNYFLYPRTVRNFDQGQIENLPDNTYLLIAKGSWARTGEMDYGWPKISVSAKQIWKFDTTNTTSAGFMRNYNPLSDKWDWGLIEVRHE